MLRSASAATAHAKRPHSQASAGTVRRALDTPGELLREDLAAPMERRLGHSFRDVRVHSDAMAATSARALGADAYTIGHDIVFGAGQYQPATPAGQETLAHELSHVVQQRGSSPVAGGMLTVDASATAEDEARRVAAQTRAATGDGIQPVSIGVGSAGTHGTGHQRRRPLARHQQLRRRSLRSRPPSLPDSVTRH